MSAVRLLAEPRSDFGKGAARRLRRDGQVPAVIYGDGSLQHVSLPAHELDLALARPRVVIEVELAGAVTLTKPREVQRDPVRRTLEHVDLIVVSTVEAQERADAAQAIADAAQDAAASE